MNDLNVAESVSKLSNVISSGINMMVAGLFQVPQFQWGYNQLGIWEHEPSTSITIATVTPRLVYSSTFPFTRESFVFMTLLFLL